MKYGIIGAGPSGLTMGLFLKAENLILEKNNHPGGHAGSFNDKGFTFDYGPHIMFSKNKEILDFMISSLGKNVHECKRKNKIWYSGRLIKYPFENDLKSLPLEDNYQCLISYLFNPYKKKIKRINNLKQWLLFHFGKGICEKYLFPYNEKVWNIPVDKLSMIWAERIPRPPAEDIIKSSLGFETEGYTHQLYYHYPLKGGYQALSDVWASKLPVEYNFKVKKISKKGNNFEVSNGDKSYFFNQIISTIPVQDLIKIIDIEIPQKVKTAVKKLIVNPMLAVYFGLQGVDKNQFTAVYFPEKEFLVNRICFPKTLSPYNSPQDYYSIQADITCSKKSETWKKSDNEILEHVQDGLIKRGFISNEKNIVYKKIIRIPYAYVVYDVHYPQNTKIIREWFPKQGVHLVGRFSYFEYINVDSVVSRSLKTAGQLNGKPVNLNKFIT